MTTEKSSTGARMNAHADPRDMLAQIVPPKPFDTREHWLSSVARKAGISYRAAKGIFYGEITDPEHRAYRRVTDKISEREQRAGENHDSPSALAGRLRCLMERQQELDREIAALASALHQDIAVCGDSVETGERASQE